jgi:hypothetical protein
VTALCRYRGIEPVITRELLDAACSSYFVDGPGAADTSVQAAAAPSAAAARKAARHRLEIH